MRPTGSGTKPRGEKWENLGQPDSAHQFLSGAVRFGSKCQNSSVDGCRVFSWVCIWRDSGKCAVLLEGLSMETWSLSLTVLLRIGRRMEAITSASRWERAKPLHINQHYPTATVHVCMKERLPVVTCFITPSRSEYHHNRNLLKGLESERRPFFSPSKLISTT